MSKIQQIKGLTADGEVVVYTPKNFEEIRLDQFEAVQVTEIMTKEEAIKRWPGHIKEINKAQ